MQKHDMHKKYLPKLRIVNPRLVMHLPKKESFSSERKKEQDKFVWEFQSTYIGIISLIAFLLLYYVWILNSNATQGYTIKQLENTQNDLQMELERLEVKIADLESLNMIEMSEVRDMMKVPTEQDYLVIRDGVQYVYNY